MILFAGIPSEGPLALAIAAAERAALPYTVFNQRHAAYCDLELTVKGSVVDGTIEFGGQRRWLGSFSGIYARMTDAASLPEHQPRGRRPPDPELLGSAQAVCALFDSLLDLFPGVVVNRPSVMGSNLSKPNQAQEIATTGLLIPPTLVTNVPEAVDAFRATHGRVIFKSISAVRSIVREWTPSGGPPVALVRDLPTQFQAYIPGDDVRVHVVGQDVFATRIESRAIDYRYAGRDGEPTTMVPMTLPAEVEASCLQVTSRLQLEMAGIDLKRAPDGAWYCFEVNPSPAYSYFQELGGQPIADALVRRLATTA